MLKKFLRFLSDNFITGVVVILPVILTIGIVRFIVMKLNSVLLIPLLQYLSTYLPAEQPRIMFAKSIIFCAVFLVLVIIGLTTRLLFVRKTFSVLEKILYRLPMVNKIYGTIKEISNAFLGKRRGVFKRAILIEYPRKGVYSIAFVTSDFKNKFSQKTQKELISAYVPTTPNPTSGIFLLIPEDEATPLDMSVEEALKMVISSGVIVSNLGSQTSAKK